MRYLLNLVRFFRSQPLTRAHIPSALGRVLRWQFATRLMNASMIIDWVGGTKLVMERGRVGATGNWYAGLMEYQDMGFILHMLRPGDLFLDIGANIGSFTILASGAVGADTKAVEPDPDTRARLHTNVRINDMEDRVTLCPQAIGAEVGDGFLTFGQDVVNHLVSEGSDETTAIQLTTIDTLTADRRPTCIKIDIEGGEHDALAGAKETLCDPSLQAVIIELNDNLDRAGHSHAELDGILRAAGLSPFGYDPLARKLTDAPIAGSDNWIYLRDREEVESRIATAPRFKVLGRDL